ncbi:MAG: hypothetical protein HUJ31_13710, partial [Pseudomonadales bacterium]|nr:hypothetical protein [Pseudomonadales bacterium]
ASNAPCIAFAISQAMAKAMQGALLASIKIAFPVVALADLVIQGGEVKLKPVVFQPLNDSTDDETSAYVDSLAELMNERPRVAITTCGVAVREDLRALRAEAFEKEIAESRKAAGYPLEAATIDTEAVDPGSEGVDEPPDDLMDAPLTTAEREQLQRLAETRAEHVEEILREEHGIDPSRLFDCRSEVKPDDQDVPRVRVTL